MGSLSVSGLDVESVPYPLNGEVTLLTIRGDIDTLSAPVFEKKLLSILQQKKFKIVVDLAGVDYVSSAGWGIFISQIRQIRGQRGDLVFACMKPEVMEVYELLEFDMILKAYPGVPEAVEKGFGQAPK